MAILLQAEPEELFQELGIRIEAIKQNPELAGSFDVETDEAEESLSLKGIATDFRAFGEKFFQRVNVEAYNLVCGDNQTALQERKQLTDAFKLGPEAVAATLAATLVAQLGFDAHRTQQNPTSRTRWRDRTRPGDCPGAPPTDYWQRSWRP